ncbi:MAG TPA: hypothetical protein P5275_18325 [Saprospiraceae bacterium]|nr:hypothetical protein [Saprospiraceae bacterium]MCB9271209.1 hypothetical protein [Lewinellaceae bacterium]HPG09322.1 hypothetical protein [Saprospiraceae bacterium]HRV86838.1 hypothetical protein [Saprospiraceae bacterium]
MKTNKAFASPFYFVGRQTTFLARILYGTGNTDSRLARALLLESNVQSVINPAREASESVTFCD